MITIIGFVSRLRVPGDNWAIPNVGPFRVQVGPMLWVEAMRLGMTEITIALPIALKHVSVYLGCNSRKE
jgi:hypothetical protein